MIYPEFPGKGDVIGICAPSSGVGAKEEWFDLSLKILKRNGFRIRETASVRSDGYPSASAEVRGRELNSLFADDRVRMVMAASGGDYNIEVLPYIDQEKITEHPKWFAGYSDPTSVEMLLTTKLDIASIYGVNAGAWDWRPLHKFQKKALSVLKGRIPLQRSYDMWSSVDFDDESFSHEMDTPVEWLLFRGSGSGKGAGDPSSELHEEQSLDVTGRLIGGCIDVIDWTLGTPYQDLPGFCERYRDDGFIWFFDNFALDPMALMYIARKFRMMGLFDHAKAVVFGRTCLPGEASDEDYLVQLERVFGDMDVPLIWNADIGHTKPSFTLINGAVGHLTFEYGSAKLSMALK